MAGLKMHCSSFSFSTKGEVEFIDLTDKVQEEIFKSSIKKGIVHVFAPHATGVILLTERDPPLLNDLRNMLEKIAPKNGQYSHPSNAHSHLRSVLLQPDRTLPVADGRITLGTWQSLLFVETDVHPRRRTITVQVIGES